MKKSASLLQIIILLTCLFSFSYFIGQEFKIVKAQGDEDSVVIRDNSAPDPASTDINSQGYVPPPSTTNTPSDPVYTESIGATLAGAAPIFTEDSVLGPGTYTSGTMEGIMSFYEKQ